MGIINRNAGYSMNKKQKTAIVALPILALMMYGIIQVAARLLGTDLAWYFGFLVYWPLWCIGYPIWILGLDSFRDLFHSRKLDIYSFSLLAFPIIFSLVGKLFFSGSGGVWGRYATFDFWEKTVYVSTAFGNGTLEEVLWRGVYIKLFQKEKLWGLVWPTIWFSLWHYAPGSMGASPYVLMGGAFVLGGCLALLAMKTNSVRWSAVSHTLASLITVI